MKMSHMTIFVDSYMEKCICGLMETILFLINIVENKFSHKVLAKIFRTEFQQNLWKEWWYIFESPLIVLGKLRFPLGQYGWKLEVSSNM
jgi:hypothetical protein